MTMKRYYSIPTTEVLKSVLEEMIATSSVTGDNGIDYGGIDKDGILEAEIRATLVDWTNND